ncbi:MAG: hypothetical protein F6J92_09730, partial [Symploca sp. SIO1A3]|nr:hypothetical protein [Symploca sp. SIO1A3]
SKNKIYELCINSVCFSISRGSTELTACKNTVITKRIKHVPAAIIFKLFNRVIPEAAVPEGLVPEAAVPEGLVPEAAVPEGLVPEGLVPEGLVPEAVVPEGLVPEAVVPEGLVPEAGFDKFGNITEPRASAVIAGSIK